MTNRLIKQHSLVFLVLFFINIGFSQTSIFENRFAPPSNDDPCNAIDVGTLVAGSPKIVTGTNVGATNAQVFADFASTTNTNVQYNADYHLSDVWYKFKLPGAYKSGKIILTTTSGKKFTIIQRDDFTCSDYTYLTAEALNGNGSATGQGGDYYTTEVFASSSNQSITSVRTYNNCIYVGSGGVPFTNATDYVYVSIGGVTVSDMGTFALSFEPYGLATGGCPVVPACTTCTSPSCTVSTVTATTVTAGQSAISDKLEADGDQYNKTLTPGQSVTICVPVTVPAGTTVLGFKQKLNIGPCADPSEQVITYNLKLSSCPASSIAPNKTNASNVSSGFNPEWNNIAAGNYVLCYTLRMTNFALCPNLDVLGLGYYIVKPACTNATINLTSAATTKVQTVCVNAPLTDITYSIAGGGTGATASGLPAGVTGTYASGIFSIKGTPTASGTFNYTVTTSGGCAALTETGTLTVSTIPNAPTATVTNPTCTLNSGTINITAVTGETYSFDGGTYSANLAYPNLVAGSSHIITAKNAAGCTSPVTNKTVGTALSAPNAPTVTVTDPTCAVNTGTINITSVTGETYSFDGGTFSATLTYPNLVAGSSHIITAKNAAGCTSAVTNRSIGNELAIPNMPNVSIIEPTCTVNTGTISITSVTGETYSFDGGTFSATLTYPNLVAGSSHTITAKNAAGCISQNNTVQVKVQPMTPNAPNIKITQPSCTNASGEILISGISGESYSINGGAFTSNLLYSNLSESTIYTFLAKNNDGCISNQSLGNIMAQPKTPIASTTTSNYLICSSEIINFSFTSDITSATFEWITNPTNVTGSFSGTGKQVNQTLFNSTSTNATVDYTITPTANGCIGLPIVVTVTVKPIPTIIAPISKSICDGDSTDITITLSDPSTTLEWKASPKSVIGAENGTGIKINQILKNSISNKVGTVTYNVIPTLNNCIGKQSTIIVNVNVTPLVNLTDGIICVDGITNNTVRPYTFNTGLNNNIYDFDWYFNGIKIANATNSSYAAKEIGEYSVLAKNIATTCISLLEKANVTSIPKGHTINVVTSDAFSENPTAVVTITGTNSILQYQLDDSSYQSSNLFEGLKEGTHTINVKDETSCTNLSANFTIIGYPHYFTPNGDGIHETWNIFGLNNQPNAKIYIFDRYGKLLKEILPSGNGWDGIFDGSILPSTDYWFTVDFIENNTNKIFKSHFSLKR